MEVGASWPLVGGVPPVWFRASLAELGEAWEVYQQRQREWWGAQTIRPSSFPDLTEAIDQVTFVPGTSLLIATRTAWTAVYHHPDDDKVTFSTGLASYVPCAWARLELGIEGEASVDRVFKFSREPRNREEVVRTDTYCQRLVTLTRENDRWKFEQFGEPLPFERLDAYKKSRRSERLTVEMLREYAAVLGIPVENMDAYAGETLLVYRPELERWPGLSAARRERDDFIEVCTKRIKRCN